MTFEEIKKRVMDWAERNGREVILVEPKQCCCTDCGCDGSKDVEGAKNVLATGSRKVN